MPEMDPQSVTVPILKDLTIDNITDNVKLINSQCENPRLKYILERTVQHLHDLARETRLSQQEWMQAIQFLTSVGQICTDVRQEFILLSDVLGLSLLVDSIDHPKPPQSTEGTVLGPFHSHEAKEAENGSLISHDPAGEECLVLCTVKDTAGQPIPGAKVDVWETDSNGFYDVQYGEREGPDQRAVLTTDKDGILWFKAIVPVPYPIPSDGPVGQLLTALKRHFYRPSHMHFMFDKSGYDPLITALYLRGSDYESSDAVFGVKESLIVDLSTVTAEMSARYSVSKSSRLLEYDFVLVTAEESEALRKQNALDAMEAQGRKVKFWQGLPIPDLD